MRGYRLYELWALLPHLPSYVEVEITMFGREMVVMARDIPKPGRRFTNLTTGTEWWPPEEMPADVTSLRIPAMESAS